ncbi:MAG: RluA family pseudouridine synthase [Acidobacteriota bacterium]
MIRSGSFRHQVSSADEGLRLDRFCATHHSEHSRSRLTELIKAGQVQLDGRSARPSELVRAGSIVTIELPPAHDDRLVPEAIPLSVLYEDDALLVIDKQAGLVVHPGAGVKQGTLAAALLNRDPRLAGVGGEGRAGLVHRLDKGTTGVIVIARHELAHRALHAQFVARGVNKLYDALVWGRPRQSSGSIDLPVGRDPKNRVKMSTRSKQARAAESRYEVKQELPGFAWVQVQILTGRTHQVRVHLTALGHPLIGDQTYGGARAASVMDPVRRRAILALQRPALHARRLELDHPTSGERMAFEAPWPDDLEQLWRALGGVHP